MQSPISQLRETLAVIKEFRQFDKQITDLALPSAAAEGEAAAEDDGDPTTMRPVLGGSLRMAEGAEPISFGEKKEDESWPQYLLRLGTHNPTASTRIMQTAMEKLDPAALMRFVESFQRLGTKQAAAVAQQKAVAEIPAAVPAPVRGWAPTG